MAFPRLSLFCHLSPQTLSSAGSRGEFYMTLKTLCVFCGKHIFNRTCWVPECVLSFHLRSSPTLCSPLSHPLCICVIALESERVSLCSESNLAAMQSLLGKCVFKCGLKWNVCAVTGGTRTACWEDSEMERKSLWSIHMGDREQKQDADTF